MVYKKEFFQNSLTTFNNGSDDVASVVLFLEAEMKTKPDVIL